jgi:hypothetical protein
MILSEKTTFVKYKGPMRHRAYAVFQALLFLQREFPRATAGIVSDFRIATDALGGKTAVNGFCETAVLDHSN